MARFLKKLLSNKTEEDGDSFTSAHLGEENNFYYNDELKQWVIRGEEDKVRESLSTAPPPPPEPKNVTDDTLLNLSYSNSSSSLSLNSQPTNNSFSPSSNTGTRRVVRSSQLYTNIPGMNVIESKPTNQSFLNIPTSTSSQFIPSKDDFDANLVNDAYADLMKSNAPATLEAPEEPQEQVKQ